MYYKNKNSSLGWSIALVILVAVIALGAVVALLPETEGGFKDKVNNFFEDVANGNDTEKSDSEDTSKAPETGEVSGGNASCEHVWNKGEITKEATCSAVGVMTYTCTQKGCGATSTVDIPATGVHTYKTYTKQSDEYHRSLCETCMLEVLTEEHDYAYSEISVTCTSNGKKIYTCKKCGFERSEVVVATGHDVATYIPSSTNATQHIGICSVCSESVSENHAYGDWEVITQATCTENGEEVQTCNVCGSQNTRLIPAIGHTPDFAADSAVVDDEKREGYCKTCGELVVHYHSYSVVVENEATCTDDGLYVKFCECGWTNESWSEVIPAIPHKYINGNTCEYCGYVNPSLPGIV